jgi:hypothetical protein
MPERQTSKAAPPIAAWVPIGSAGGSLRLKRESDNRGWSWSKGELCSGLNVFLIPFIDGRSAVSNVWVPLPGPRQVAVIASPALDARDILWHHAWRSEALGEAKIYVQEKEANANKCCQLVNPIV